MFVGKFENFLQDIRRYFSFPKIQCLNLNVLWKYNIPFKWVPYNKIKKETKYIYVVAYIIRISLKMPGLPLNIPEKSKQNQTMTTKYTDFIYYATFLSVFLGIACKDTVVLNKCISDKKFTN